VDIKIINRNTKIRRQTKGHPVKGQYTYNNVKEQQILYLEVIMNHSIKNRTHEPVQEPNVLYFMGKLYPKEKFKRELTHEPNIP
jgi:hypothetical protein